MKRGAAVLVAGLVGLLMLSLFIGGGAQDETQGCGVGGDGVRVNVANLPKVAGFSKEQLENAALIINAGNELGVDRRAQAIAVMTAMGESTLINTGHGDSVGPDSRGLFQQRANGAWGSEADRMDPTKAATAFYKALVKVKGWKDLAPTLAASRVQGNADPYHYEQHWTSALKLVDALAEVKVEQSGSSTSGMDAAAAIKKYNLGQVREVTASAVGVLAPQFGITTVGGWRPVDPYPDHPSGLAADFMVPLDASGAAKGDRLATYLTEHAEEFGIDYLLWQQRSWYPGRGWKPMSDRGSPTANHMDHVHVTFTGDKSSGALPAVSGCAVGEDTGAGVVASGSKVVPAKGPVTSGFGPRNISVPGASKFHKGTDFGAPCDAPILATLSGTVVYAGPMSGYGHLIEIDHGGGTRTRYAHMFADDLLTRVGDSVKGGQQIGRVGSDGVSGGCHLHFEVIVNDQHTDPQPWLEKG